MFNISDLLYPTPSESHKIVLNKSLTPSVSKNYDFTSKIVKMVSEFPHSYIVIFMYRVIYDLIYDFSKHSTEVSS